LKKSLEQGEVELKYDGYIQRQQDLIDKMEKVESTTIPLNFNFSNLISISAEGREKLNKVKPRSIGQASRISGVTPSDISVLVYLKINFLRVGLLDCSRAVSPGIKKALLGKQH
jgi:tRNA uridine 5-carboxymethylaminomethyl modification enzyme